MTLDVVDLAALALAGGFAGAINAAAGGGSLISFPVLVAVGYPALTANVTNTVALCPGYLGGTVGYRSELAGQRARLRWLGAISMIGAIAGAVLLALTPRDAFRLVVPFLVLAACALLAVQPLLTARLRTRGGHRGGTAGVPLAVGQLVAAAYGAYFGAALGVIMLGVLGTLVDDELQRLNALKGALSLMINWVAAACFIAFAPVAWLPVAVLAPASLLGGRLGVGVARHVSDRSLRVAVIVFGVASAVFLLVA